MKMVRVPLMSLSGRFGGGIQCVLYTRNVCAVLRALFGQIRSGLLVNNRSPVASFVVVGVSYGLAFTNEAFNPLIYSLMDKRYTRAIFSLFPVSWRRKMST